MRCEGQKTKNNGQRISVFCLLSAVLCLVFPAITLPALAQATLRAEADSDPDYLASLTQLFDAANQIAPEALRGEGPLLRINPDGVVSTQDNARLSAPDQELADAARRVFSLYRSMGGQTGTRALMLQRTKNGLFAAREGSSGSLSTSLGAAMGGALQSLARADASLPATVAAWLPQLATAMETPGMPPPAYPVARVPLNQRTLITLSGPEIARAGPDAILAGPPGSTINILRTQARQMQASAVFTGASTQGFNTLYLYRSGDALTPVTSFDVAVGAGRANGPVTAEPDDHGASAKSATPLLQSGALRASRDGQIGAANDVDMFTLRVTAPGMLAVNSRGSSDVTAHLLDSRGNPIARNDDGGPGYNFGMQTPVNPGTYLLSVQHCCGGGGNYHIDAALTPQ